MKSIRLMVAAAAWLAAAGAAQAAPIRYAGFVLADVSIAGTLYQGAQVTLYFDADTRDSVAYTDGSAHGYKNSKGKASVRIVSGATTINAALSPGQVFVFFDWFHASAGFGSSAGYGYPLALGSPPGDGAEPLSGNLVGAVASIANNPSSKADYTAPTASLSADLRSPTVLAGIASSCASTYDPVNVTCPASATPLALNTDQGELLIYEPYSVTYPAGSTFVYAANYGMFWSELLGD